MGRKLNVSTPTVINTELVPLDESFYIEAIGQTEQWYYDNTNQFQPNRTVTPLTLVPHVSAYDKDAQRSYTPLFQIVRWFEQAWDATEGEYVETEITNQTDSPTAEYVKLTNNNLLVKKNVPYSHAITIRCEATYVDPRDNGITYATEERVLLVTNRDAKIVYPTLDVLCPSAQSYNPLIDASSEFSMQAKADYSAVVDSDVAEYRVDKGGTEEIVPQNETEVVTSAPFLDLRYGTVEQENQQFMYRATGGGGLTDIDGNVAYVNKIKGNTVKWNQILYNGNFSSSSGWYANSVNTISVSNHTLTIKATSQNVNVFARRMSSNFPKSHKCVFVATVKPSVNTTGTAIAFNETAISLHSLTAGSWTVIKDIATSPASYNVVAIYPDISVAQPVGTELQVRNFMMFDLTEMGIASQIETVADFEQWLAQNIGLKSYYPYNEGELIPVKMSAIKSVGFNLWDEEWEVGGLNTNTGENLNLTDRIRSKNFISCLPDVTYYVQMPTTMTMYLLWYDSDKHFIRFNAPNYTSVSPSNAAYFRFSMTSTYGTTYNHDICINISDASRNGQYEAHWEFNRSLPVTQLTGKQVGGTNASVVIFPNGMQHVGNVFDEIIVDGGQIKAVKRCAVLNLGNMQWTQYPQGHGFYTRLLSASSTSGALCGKYRYAGAWDNWSHVNDKEFFLTVARNSINICDYSYDSSTVEQFTSDMDGVYLVYELETPITYIIDNMPKGIFEWYGISNNAEVLVETLPWYKSGQHTDTLVVDAMYGEDIRVVLRAKDSHGALIPPKVHRNVHWRIPDIDSNVVSENGSSVRGIPMDMTFGTIVNVNGTVLSDDAKKNHLRFNWKTRRSQPANSPEVDKGWGAKKILTSTELQNSYQANMATTIVFPYVYLAGAYEEVSLVNDPVTYNGEPVFDREIEEEQVNNN